MKHACTAGFTPHQPTLTTLRLIFWLRIDRMLSVKLPSLMTEIKTLLHVLVVLEIQKKILIH